MDLWVRSQQKEMLFKVNESLILRNGPGERYFIECDGHKIAMYKTYERAIEVLDEIEKIIGWCQKDLRDVTVGDLENLIGNFNNYVYEMSKE
jgi:hypothetical protein